MKSFKQFLNEEITEFDNFWKIIEKECSEILKIYSKINKGQTRWTRDNRFLFRGINAKEMFIQNKKIRQDRKTIDTPEYVHNTINKAITDLNFKSHRGNSIFCTNMYHVANDWGNVYYIFPKNGFEYLWFRKQSEKYMYNVWEGAVDREAYEYDIKFMSDNDIVDKMELIKAQKKDPKLQNAYDVGYNKAMAKMVKRFEPSDKNLEDCLVSNWTLDILVSGPDYHAINNEYLPEILKALQ